MLTMDIYTIADRCTMTFLCAWSSLEAVTGASSLLSDILLCLLTSPVRTQLMLTVPHWGPGAPSPQRGVPSPRVRTHSLSRVQSSYFPFLINFNHF
jgi:hypothetical protein